MPSHPARRKRCYSIEQLLSFKDGCNEIPEALKNRPRLSLGHNRDGSQRLNAWDNLNHEKELQRRGSGKWSGHSAEDASWRARGVSTAVVKQRSLSTLSERSTHTWSSGDETLSHTESNSAWSGSPKARSPGELNLDEERELMESLLRISMGTSSSSPLQPHEVALTQPTSPVNCDSPLAALNRSSRPSLPCETVTSPRPRVARGGTVSSSSSMTETPNSWGWALPHQAYPAMQKQAPYNTVTPPESTASFTGSPQCRPDHHSSGTQYQRAWLHSQSAQPIQEQLRMSNSNEYSSAPQGTIVSSQSNFGVQVPPQSVEYVKGQVAHTRPLEQPLGSNNMPYPQLLQGYNDGQGYCVRQPQQHLQQQLQQEQLQHQQYSQHQQYQEHLQYQQHQQLQQLQHQHQHQHQQQQQQLQQQQQFVQFQACPQQEQFHAQPLRSPGQGYPQQRPAWSSQLHAAMEGEVAQGEATFNYYQAHQQYERQLHYPSATFQQTY
mmetsp:Transcript_14380/g.25758  ORF Transcript_14380/g.25758 Transcript_14380/m.25758 type:complete len:493 (+) Transcript_14380:88-1566(+)